MTTVMCDAIIKRLAMDGRCAAATVIDEIKSEKSPKETETETCQKRNGVHTSRIIITARYPLGVGDDSGFLRSAQNSISAAASHT